jgi:tRNA dimethylallyltransferase
MADSAFQKIANKGLKCLLNRWNRFVDKSILRWLTPTPPPNPEFRRKLLLEINKNGLEKYYSQLIRLDPGVISKIKKNDKLRIIRALEIIENSSLLPSEIKWNTSKIRYKTLRIGCQRPKDVLYQIAEQKITAWISEGWIDEVECLLGKGIDPNYPAMKALGYSHIVQYLENRFSKATLVELITRYTRRYIKRQLTWFRADKRIHWLDTHRPIRQVVREALELINNPS